MSRGSSPPALRRRAARPRAEGLLDFLQLPASCGRCFQRRVFERMDAGYGLGEVDCRSFVPRAMTVTPEWLRHQIFLFGTSSLQAGKVDFREFALACYQARSPRRPRTYCFCLPHPPSGQCRRARPVDGIVAFARLGTAGVNETVRLLKTTRDQFATLSREALARFTFDAYSDGAGRLGRDESEKMIEEVRRASLAVVG